MERRRTTPISQVEIENELLYLLQHLEHETETFEKVADDAARKEADYKLSWAKSYLNATGSIKARETWADYESADPHLAYQIAEALVRAKREKLNSLRTAIDAMRTLNANLRTLTAP